MKKILFGLLSVLLIILFVIAVQVVSYELKKLSKEEIEVLEKTALIAIYEGTGMEKKSKIQENVDIYIYKKDRYSEKMIKEVESHFDKNYNKKIIWIDSSNMLKSRENENIDFDVLKVTEIIREGKIEIGIMYRHNAYYRKYYVYIFKEKENGWEIVNVEDRTGPRPAP